MEIKENMKNNIDTARESPAVSVIVPIYNAGELLKLCLNSLRRQTMDDFEVIMIDDSSSDNCHVTAESFAKKDSRFFYYRVDRGGVANARNAGLSKARGEYIAFVDSDDYVEREYLEELYNTAVSSSCKVSSCNYSLVYFDKPGKNHPIRVRKLRSGVYSNKYYVTQIIRDWKVRSYLWNKLWHRSLFFDNDITFPSMYFEDIATVARLAYYTDRVAVVDKPLYHYMVHKGSIMTTAKVEKINDYILSYGIIRNFLEYRGDTKTYRAALEHLGLIIYFANYFNLIQLHYVRGSYKYLFKNIRTANRLIMYFIKGEFTPTEDYPKMPEYIFDPEDLRGSKRKRKSDKKNKNTGSAKLILADDDRQGEVRTID